MEGPRLGDSSAREQPPGAPSLIHLRSFLLAGQRWQDRASADHRACCAPAARGCCARSSLSAGGTSGGPHPSSPACQGTQPPWGLPCPGPSASPALAAGPGCSTRGRQSQHTRLQGRLPASLPRVPLCRGQASPLTVPWPLLPPRSHTQPCAQERYKSGRWTLQRRAGRWRLLGRPLQEPLQPGGGRPRPSGGQAALPLPGKPPSLL